MPKAMTTLRGPIDAAARAGIELARSGHAGRGWFSWPAAAARCTTSPATSRTMRAISSMTALRRGRWSPAPFRAAIRSERGKASAEHLRHRQDGGQARGDAAVPGRPRGARARAGALPDLLHALPRRAGRRPGHDRPPRVQPAADLSQRRAAQRSRSATYFDVMTRGYGTMYSYASRIPPSDRWAIAAYIRALQLSQHAVAAELPAEDQGQLEGDRVDEP